MLPPLKPGLAELSSELRAGLDEPLPALTVGDAGTAVAITGWCFHPFRPIRRLALTCGGNSTPVALQGIQRRELRGRYRNAGDLNGNAEWSGFAGVIPIQPHSQPCSHTLEISATLEGGAIRNAALGVVRIEPKSIAALPEQQGTRSRTRGTGKSRIAICLTTYNPPIDLFVRQIASIRAQTETAWTCIVSDDHSRGDRFAAIRSIVGDDPRFTVYRQPVNKGFYRNFEDCLSLAPPEVEYVALADQDDVWHRDKLAVLLTAFKPRTTLVYSDALIVTAD